MTNFRFNKILLMNAHVLNDLTHMDLSKTWLVPVANLKSSLLIITSRNYSIRTYRLTKRC
jgi:hypothetical protein